ncbi:MAG: alpha/beta fold hydrolase [Planctomycetia bacterium]|nr:alpha/beta fold hydrolase [Planctomycetia bacterium]
MSGSLDWRSLYPFTSHFLPIGPHRLHYVDEGAGPPLLLLHGNPTWSFYWRRVIEPWRKKFRVVAPDHIGCGLSDKPGDYEYTLARHIENVLELVRSLDLKEITLVAHDWGGPIGLGAAVAMPERFARLVLLNTAAFRSTRVPWRIRACRIPLVGALAVRILNLFVRGTLRMATEFPGRLRGAVRAGYLAPYDSWAHRVAVHRFVQDIPLSPRHRSYAKLLEIEQGLPRLADRPVLLAWGMKDWCFTTHFLDRFLGFFPAAEVRRMEAAGHLVAEDAAEELAPLVEDFIARSPPADLCRRNERLHG